MDKESEISEKNVKLYKNAISNPLAEDKLASKLLKLTKKMNAVKLIRRGVKEVNKVFRKKEKGLCIIAADVSPVDVVSHIPVCCEKNNIPYIFVPSREALGENAGTKRPTSVVILIKPPKDFKHRETYDKLIDVVKEINPLFNN